MNLLKSINLSLAHVYYSNLLSNHELIRLIDSSRNLQAICENRFFSSTFNTLCMCPKIDVIDA